MANKGNSITNLGSATTFPKGTVVTKVTDIIGQKSTTVIWTFNGEKFTSKDNPKGVTPGKLFPSGMQLDATGDGIYNDDDLTKFKKMSKDGTLSENLNAPLVGDYFIRHGVLNDASINENGNLSIITENKKTSIYGPKLKNTDNMTSANTYIIDLPEKKK